MRRIFLSIVPILILSGYVFAGTIPTRTGDQNGMFIGSETDQYDNGSGLYTGIQQGELGIKFPAFNPRIVILAPEAASATAYRSVTISTTTLTASGTSWYAIKSGGLALTQPITPRNLVFIASFAGGTSTKTATCSAYIQGYNQRGKFTTETIAFSTNSGVGYVAWIQVSTVTITASKIATEKTGAALTLSMGSGTKLGIEAQIYSKSEILKINESTTAINPSLTTGATTYDLTYNTYVPVKVIPNGSVNYTLFLKPKKR